MYARKFISLYISYCFKDWMILYFLIRTLYLSKYGLILLSGPDYRFVIVFLSVTLF